MMIEFFCKILNRSSSNSITGVPKRDRNPPCKRVACTKSTISEQSNLFKNGDVKRSSSKTTRTWNGSCNTLVCLFGESKSRPSSPSRVNFVKKKIETKSSLAHTVTVVESVESSSVVQCDCENDSGLNRVVPPAVDEKQIQDTACPPMCNLSSNILINQSPERDDESQASEDSRPERDDESQASEDSQSSSMETESEISADSTRTTDTAENDSSSSQEQPWSDGTVYHIRWKGYEMEYEPSGYKCMICDVDLSISPSGNDDEHSEDNDDEDDDEYYDEYQDEPQLLPGVDILSCGHAFHTECSTSSELITDEQSTNPECSFCLSMA